MASIPITITDFKKQMPGHLSDDKCTFMFDKITSINSHGKRTEWQIMVRLFKYDGIPPKSANTIGTFIEIKDEYFDNKPMPADIYAWIKVRANVEGGKVRDSEATIVNAGKNIGRSNATNVFCQALRDAFGLHNKQAKKAFAEGPIGSTTRYPPMLAQNIKDQSKSPFVLVPKPPAYEPTLHERIFVQRKYNGLRTVMTLDKTPDGAEFAITYGRRKLAYPGFHYIKDELLPILKFYWEQGRELYIDGEVYKHGMPLQDISSYARREDKPEDVRLDYMVYDCFVANEPGLIFSKRLEIINEIFDNFDHFQYVKRAETYEITKYDYPRLEELYAQFLAEEYEGAMIRLNEPYKYSYNEHHSKILLKKKPAYDEEYEIIGWTTGAKGKASEALMIICVTKEGKEFTVTPAMEIPDRIALAKKFAEIDKDNKTFFETQYKSKKINVVFDELSRDHVPQRARTKLLRLDIDIMK